MAYDAELEDTARKLVRPGRGILAADESTPTIGKRFATIATESTEDTRRSYRGLLFSTTGAEEFISGVILFDETLRQSGEDGTPFVTLLEGKGIVPGIKVDTGAKPLPGANGETVTEGLDGLRQRLEEYRSLGARFAKWRAVLTIDEAEGLPSDYAIEVNAHALARYAALSVEQGLVPIVEPEVLMDGDHTIDTCLSATRRTLTRVFSCLAEHRVPLPQMLLKPNMVISGKDCPQQAGPEEVARKTTECFTEVIPSALPGIVFLSGGQSDTEATANLDAMNKLGDFPWQLSFSYGRALQSSALIAWAGKPENKEVAQSAFYKRARLAGAARYGTYSPEMESEL